MGDANGGCAPALGGMKSPRFDLRARPLKSIFSPSNIERIWKDKVRVAMRDQFLCDGIEHFDFHTSLKSEAQKLSQLILEGDYVPSRAQRILVEKSKGLCRQMVIPSVPDAIVLQCLSDALYAQIRDKAPTRKSFYEPKDHKFSWLKSEYGTFAAWLNFQRELFNFSKNRKFVVVADIANYYDSISYEHLRNVISSITNAEECILDMLIYVLSDLLWQPDYTPRVEIGLPQINMDAPRLLAHCLLYELDKYLDSDPSRDFVRYMDDIDIGVDSVPAAKQVLRSVDLVLQTKQLRLNSGKTHIMTSGEARRHFRVFENARLDRLQDRIDRRKKAGLSLALEQRLISTRVREGLSSEAFNTGNGEKILKRWIGLAGKTNARLAPRDLHRIVLLRPQVRENIFAFIRKSDLTEARARTLADAASSGHLVDDYALVELANHLVETKVPRRNRIDHHIVRAISAFDEDNYFGFYSSLWMRSKYSSTSDLLDIISKAERAWAPHERLGRIVGALVPLFVGSTDEAAYLEILQRSRNAGVRETFKFHQSLRTQASVFDKMYPALSNPNPSRGTGITHPKFLCLLTALANKAVPPVRIAKLKAANSLAFQDIYYRSIGRRTGAI